MNKKKHIKDPIYGYIDISIKYIDTIIDTAQFQRLRRISQTSYAPLFPSSVHNRFLHSIGVYYLGSIASKQLLNEVQNKLPNFDSYVLDNYRRIFRLACLLHDVGHAPFSHTGEIFYLDEHGDSQQLHTYLVEILKSKNFEEAIPDSSHVAAPHEIMSAIIGIENYCKIIGSIDDQEFFARCILGYKYQKSDNVMNYNIQNCFIALLNSQIIDVDKLDYLIRDAYMTGFNTVNIDYKRLLKSITITKFNDNTYDIAYYKSAISVIENVVYAHDLERKWIQKHPTVLYENYILHHAMAMLQRKLDSTEHKLFSPTSLTSTGTTLLIKNSTDKGQELQGKLHISLLSDDDIIFLMKQYPDELCMEFFERSNRRHPVWKSESEYKAYILSQINGGDVIDKFEEDMSLTAKYLTKNTEISIINTYSIDKLKYEIQQINSPELDVETQIVQNREKQKILNVMLSLQKYVANENMECDFIILKESQFYSGFGKADFANINIVFNDQTTKKFGDIVSSLIAKDKERDTYFYLFYKRCNKNKVIDGYQLCKILLKDIGLAMN